MSAGCCMHSAVLMARDTRCTCDLSQPPPIFAGGPLVSAETLDGWRSVGEVDHAQMLLNANVEQLLAGLGSEQD